MKIKVFLSLLGLGLGTFASASDSCTCQKIKACGALRYEDTRVAGEVGTVYAVDSLYGYRFEISPDRVLEKTRLQKLLKRAKASQKEVSVCFISWFDGSFPNVRKATDEVILSNAQVVDDDFVDYSYQILD